MAKYVRVFFRVLKQDAIPGLAKVAGSEVSMWFSKNLAAELELEMEKDGLVRIYGGEK